MATIQTPTNESVYQIKRWLGVNEAPEGDTRLKIGEAAKMRNFRITAGGALQKRAGSVRVAGLMQSYNVVQDGTEPVTLIRETGISDRVLTLYPRATTDSVGTPKGDGTAVTAGYDQAGDYAGYYYERQDGDTISSPGVSTGPTSSTQSEDSGIYKKSAADDVLYKFKDCVYTASKYTGVQGRPGWTLNADNMFTYNVYGLFFDAPPVFHNGEWDLSTGEIYCIWANGQADAPDLEYGVEKYFIPDGSGGSTVVQASVFASSKPEVSELTKNLNPDGIYGKGKIVEKVADINTGVLVRMQDYEYTQPVYSWNFYPMTSVGNGTDRIVRGIWSGFVGGREVLCAACNGHLWELYNNDIVNGIDSRENWSKTDCGNITTDEDVFMFGFDEKLYILNGSQYKVWDGTQMTDVVGYRPLVSVSVLPSGGGTQLEQVNKLTGAKRCRFSPDGEATDFYLPETGIASVDYVKNVGTGQAITAYTADTAAGKITFTSAPEKGVNSLEVGWTHGTNAAAEIKAMRYGELYNGKQDSRVFLYGDGSNKSVYSGLDSDGQPRADYFPDLNVCHVGDENTPITGMIRHYSKLLAFKLDSAYSISYDTITLVDGSVTAGFYVTPVNRDIGNCALGQVQLVENKPRTLDGRSVIEWKTTISNYAGDQRNAERISQRVGNTIESFDLDKARTFYDKYNHEYYVIGQTGTALVNGIDADAWYIYTGFDYTCLINYKDRLFGGTRLGDLVIFSYEAYSDYRGSFAMDCYWESGSMPFDRDYMRKYSATIWIGLKPRTWTYLRATAQTDRKSDFAEYIVPTAWETGIPTMEKIKLKAKKFTYYKLILINDKPATVTTVVSADIRVRATGYVR